MVEEEKRSVRKGGEIGLPGGIIVKKREKKEGREKHLETESDKIASEIPAARRRGWLRRRRIDNFGGGGGGICKNK